MQYDKQDLIQKVIAEATALRVHATASELAKLNFERLKPNSPWLCIYGQMCDFCNGDRAIELLNKCAEPFSESGVRFEETNLGFEYRNSLGPVVGIWSAIEFYILRRFAKKRPLVEYIKGERETLTPKDLEF